MKRTAFTLTELLVVIATVILLMSLVLAGVSAARSSQRKNQTRVTISKINDILMNQWRTYPSQYGSAGDVRLRITGDLPPSWYDVAGVSSNTSFKTRAQQTYRQFWNKKSQTPTDRYGDSECLFLSVMHGGFAGCLDCAGLRSGKDFGDIDSDGFEEFIDAWGNPLGFVLWPVGLRTPGGTADFFPWANTGDSLTFAIRPLVFSAGPNGRYGVDIGDGRQSDHTSTATFSTLYTVQQSGFPGNCSNIGSVLNASFADDNLTNFDAEFRR